MTMIVLVTVVMAMVIISTDASDMVVVALLGCALIAFKSDDLFAIFTQLTIHHARAIFRVVQSIDESLNDVGVVI